MGRLQRQAGYVTRSDGGGHRLDGGHCGGVESAAADLEAGATGRVNLVAGGGHGGRVDDRVVPVAEQRDLEVIEAKERARTWAKGLTVLAVVTAISLGGLTYYLRDSLKRTQRCKKCRTVSYSRCGSSFAYSMALY